MKQTEQLSIGGYAFTLEKDAADALSEYITSLENHYLGQEGGKEIMEGIEERVAELLLEKCGSQGVGTLSHVYAIIDIIGRPERIEADDPEPAAREEKPRRRLFRDLENKRLGGVCAGLAAYLTIDVAWLRVAFVVLFCLGIFGIHNGLVMTAPVIYAILWVAMPAARTAQDRWAMRGESGTLDEIRRNVADGVREMGNAAREVGRSDFFRSLGKVILIVVGLILLITSTSGLASVSVLSLKGTELFGSQIIHGLDELALDYPAVMDLISTPWVLVLLVLAVVLPLVGMLYAGIQLIFGFKSPSWKPGLVVFVLWLIIIIVLLVLFITAGLSSGALPADWI